MFMPYKTSNKTKSHFASLKCWWLGCTPDYDHPTELKPNYAVPCQRCGANDTSYADRVGDTRHSRLKSALRYWLRGRWASSPCTDCGKRSGNNDQCLPF